LRGTGRNRISLDPDEDTDEPTDTAEPFGSWLFDS